MSGKWIALWIVFKQVSARPFECPSPNSYGEYAHNVRYFTFENQLILTEGVYHLEENFSANRCFNLCDLEKECLLAVVEERRRRCALAYVNTDNAFLICRNDFDQVQSVSVSASESLDCSSGCRAMEKVCPHCNHTSLDFLVTLVTCSTRYSSISEFCGSPTPRTTTSPPPPLLSGDEDAMCVKWASGAQCSDNPGFMCRKCRGSCGASCASRPNRRVGRTTTRQPCFDEDDSCAAWKIYCAWQDYVRQRCKWTCQLC